MFSLSDALVYDKADVSSRARRGGRYCCYVVAQPETRERMPTRKAITSPRAPHTLDIRHFWSSLSRFLSFFYRKRRREIKRNRIYPYAIFFLVTRTRPCCYVSYVSFSRKTRGITISRERVCVLRLGYFIKLPFMLNARFPGCWDTLSR